jgi:hypothetical protein
MGGALPAPMVQKLLQLMLLLFHQKNNMFQQKDNMVRTMATDATETADD